MTSVTFDFLVGQPDPETKKIKLNPVEFRFGTKAARQLEVQAGVGIEWLVARGQSVHTLVLVVWHGLLWDKHLKITEEKAMDLIDGFIDAGGDVEELSKAAFKALRESGVYGKPVVDDEKKDDEKKDGDVPK